MDSHAYSVARYKKKWVVADAGGNDLLWVTNRGKISTLAVLPSQPAKITEEFAKAQGLPDCVIGVTYKFEAVPTDVEVGRDGYLYVTTLPGGAEDASLGARGKVYRVNPRNGHIKLVASGFLGATNLALGKHHKIFVAELFGGQISVVKHGKAHKYLSLPGVVAVEIDRTARSGRPRWVTRTRPRRARWSRSSRSAPTRRPSPYASLDSPDTHHTAGRRSDRRCGALLLT